MLHFEIQIIINKISKNINLWYNIRSNVYSSVDKDRKKVRNSWAK